VNEAPTQILVPPNAGYRRGDRLGRVRLHQKGILAVAQDLRDGTDTGRDHRPAGGERLQRDTPESLGEARRVHHDVGRGVEVVDVVEETGEPDSVGNPELRDKPPKGGQILFVDRSAERPARDDTGDILEVSDEQAHGSERNVLAAS